MSVTLGGDLKQALAELCQAQLELVYLFVDLVSVCLWSVVILCAEWDHSGMVQGRPRETKVGQGRLVGRGRPR